METFLLFGVLVGFLLGLVFMERSLTTVAEDQKAFSQMEKEYPILSTKPAFQFAKSLNKIKGKILKKKK